MTYITQWSDYKVTQTTEGLDVRVKGRFVCELKGRTFDDYTYNGEIDDIKLEDDIDFAMLF